MSTPIFRYQLDPTGTNPDNKVVGELITLDNFQNRAGVPSYGPIFAESLLIYDNVTNQPLVRDTDYKLLELVQSATGKFGKEIVAAFLIINSNISSTIRLDYQVLGGLYQFDDTAVTNIYNTFLNDGRGIPWVDVLNKPLEFPPSLHNHLLADIYGFEPVVVALERIRNAIAISDLPAYRVLVDWVISKIQLSTLEDIQLGNSNQNLVTNERLIQSLQEFNFNTILLDPLITSVVDGGSLTFNLRTTNLPNNTVLYWTISHIGTSNSDFTTTSGVINIVNNQGNFTVQLAPTPLVGEIAEGFAIDIRKTSITGFSLLRSPVVTIGAHSGGLPVIDLKMACCLFNPNIQINADSYFLIKEY